MIFSDDETMKIRTELEPLLVWFGWYDNQVAQYHRCVRMGDVYDGDIEILDEKAKQKQLRIRELRMQLGN